VLGAFGAGFVLIPAIGIRMTIYVAVVMNVVIGISAFAMFMKEKDAQSTWFERVKKTDEANGNDSNRVDKIILLQLFGFAASGMAAMIYQVAWTRALTLVIGSSTYAFSLIVTAFILGLALGGIVISRRVDEWRHAIFSMSLFQYAIAAASIVFVVIMCQLPGYILKIIADLQEEYSRILMIEFGIVFLAILFPTFFMGAMFPTMSKSCYQKINRIGQSIGNIYAYNTIGAIIGSFACGFILIPMIGIQNSIYTAVGVNVLVGSLFLYLSGRFRRVTVALTVSGAILAASVAVMQLPKWNRRVMTAGVSIYGPVLTETFNPELFESVWQQLEVLSGRIVFYEEGLTATVAVLERGDKSITLLINGKSDASSKGDLKTQILLGQIPLALCRSPEKVLVIGLGSGITLASAATWPVSKIDCVEISPEVVTVAKVHFAEHNKNILNRGDERIELIIGDARTHVLLSAEKYDVITSEPSNPWIAGMGSLFSREFYGLCRARLAPGGVMCQWVQTYSLSTQNVKTVVRTFCDAFKHVQLWEGAEVEDLILIGSDEKISMDVTRITESLSREETRQDLAQIQVTSPAHLVAQFICEGDSLREFAADGVINTDDNLHLEFSGPKDLYRTQTIAFLEELNSVRTNPCGLLENAAGDESLNADCDKLFRTKVLFMRARTSLLQNNSEEARNRLEQAHRLNPDDKSVRSYLAKFCLADGMELLNANRPRDAALFMGKAARLDPEDAVYQFRLGMCHKRLGDTAKALACFRKALDLDTRSFMALNEMGVVQAMQDDLAKAVECWEKALEIFPGYSFARGNLEKAAKMSPSR